MAILKCKMCGGELEITNGQSVATCEYCGTVQTLPRLDNDRRANLYDRANHFRRNNDFDKAESIYEKILNEDQTDAEAYWSLVLCRYGIEYVEDPATHKRVPTVNRAQFTSVFDDDNYKSALQYADSFQRGIYEAEAKAINEIQKGILAISQKEEPFDVFICYKETDRNGRRTPDSVLANDLYHQLTQEGFKVFFSRITLEDKLGSAYEPYIFAALNSAKIMVVLGTKPEYFSAVWVKNEWSRYLALIRQGQKKMLIPAYKDMDPYDLPEEFSHLQAQDMGKLGFMQDLIRGIRKIAQTDEPKAAVVKETVISGGNGSTVPLLKRAFMFLEDEEWDSADEYCEKVLDIDPENPQAYLGKLMAELQVSTQEELKNVEEPFDNNKTYRNLLHFSDNALRITLTGYIDHILKEQEMRKEQAILRRNAFKPLIAKHLESQANWSISAGVGGFTVALKSDGTVVADSRYCDFSGWTDIMAISTGGDSLDYTTSRVIGLNSDGTVIVDSYTPKEVYGWTNIVAVAAMGGYGIVGLKSDGTVVASTQKYEVSDWTDIVAVTAGKDHIVGLKSDGTVVAVGSNTYGQCKVSRWTDIMAVVAGEDHTVGLKSDGTVVAVGSNIHYQCEVSGWTNIVAVAAGKEHTVALKSNGTVVAAGMDFMKQCKVSGWTDIIAVAAGEYHTVGLKSDGTLVAAGLRYATDSKLSSWTDIAVPQAAIEQRKMRIKSAKEEAARRERAELVVRLHKEQETLQIELANLKGLFSGRRRKEIEARLEKIKGLIAWNTD